MREQASVPRWALRHIREQLGPGEEIINAVSFRQGLLTGVVLLNTSRGAAIVTKAAVGDPRSALLTFPRDLLTFRCEGCQKRNLLVDATLPTDVHCTHCGEIHHLTTPGTVRARHLKDKNAGNKSAGKKSAGKKSAGKKSAGKKSAGKKSTPKKAGRKPAGKKATKESAGTKTSKKTTSKRSR